jgi:hypothetical protein
MKLLFAESAKDAALLVAADAISGMKSENVLTHWLKPRFEES